MTESNVDLIIFIDKHPFASLCIVVSMIFLALMGLGIGMANIGNENRQKIMDSFVSLSCEQLVNIPNNHGHWMNESLFPENENKFLSSWHDNMQRCLK